jgi:hypothetical protein
MTYDAACLAMVVGWMAFAVIYYLWPRKPSHRPPIYRRRPPMSEPIWPDPILPTPEARERRAERESAATRRWIAYEMRRKPQP